MPDIENTIENIEPIIQLDKDLKQAARLLGKKEARYLVDQYYVVQQNRIRANSQIKSMSEIGEPNRVIQWEAENQRRFENNLKSALGVFVQEYTVGKWLMAQCGIGPVISAGLLAHLDITRAPHYGNFWSFAGCNPTAVWTKGKTRPWNAALKSLVLFKAGESFVKVQNNDKDVYGHIFANHKKRYWELNLTGRNTEYCTKMLQEKNYQDKSAAKAWLQGKIDNLWARRQYESGESFPMPLPKDAYLRMDVRPFPMLPPAQIHARARRKAVKLFLVHLHGVMYWDYYGCEPPEPYVFEMMEGHTQRVPIPNYPIPKELIGKKLREMHE